MARCLMARRSLSARQARAGSMRSLQCRRVQCHRMLDLLAHLLADRPDFGGHYRCLLDAVKDHLRLFAVFLRSVFDVGDGVLAIGGHRLRAFHAIDQRRAHLLEGFDSAFVLRDHRFSTELADLIDIGMMLDIGRHRQRLRSYRGRRKIDWTVPPRRVFCQRLGDAVLNIHQTEILICSGGLCHYSILPCYGRRTRLLLHRLENPSQFAFRQAGFCPAAAINTPNEFQFWSNCPYHALSKVDPAPQGSFGSAPYWASGHVDHWLRLAYGQNDHTLPEIVM